MNSLPQQSDQHALTSITESTIELIESSISQSTKRAYAGALGRLVAWILTSFRINSISRIRISLGI